MGCFSIFLKTNIQLQMYGQTLVEFVQGPGEVVFLPQQLTHCVLNLQDNVAYTENYLYIGALPGKLRTCFIGFDLILLFYNFNFYSILLISIEKNNVCL